MPTGKKNHDASGITIVTDEMLWADLYRLVSGKISLDLHCDPVTITAPYAEKLLSALGNAFRRTFGTF